jgi:hypothetical protein
MKKLIFLGSLIAIGFAACQTGSEPASATTEAKDSKSTEAANSSGNGQVPLPNSFADVPQPANNVNMQPGYVKTIAQMAYVWGWPMVNQYNRRTNITKAPYPALNGGIVPIAPMGKIGMLVDYVNPMQSFVTCPNQDVIYGLGYYSLNAIPVIVQVPDFGDRFWVYAFYDARSDQFAKLGKQYKTKPGFYMLVGPKWNGKVPDGVTEVIRSSTELANTIPRIFLDDTKEDRAAVQAAVNQVLTYPVTEFDGKMKTFDYSKLPVVGEGAKKQEGETQWVVPELFFDMFSTVLDSVAPLPGEEAMYANFRQLMDAAAKNPEVKKAMIAAAVETEKMVIDHFFRWEHNGTPAGNNWNRSTNNSKWGVDYFNRTGTAKSNFFDNQPEETQYFYTDYDGSRVQLHGKNNYSITFAKGKVPPVNGFWSLTLYNDKHLFNPNALNRYSLGTKNKTLKYNADGSLTLYTGNKSPGADKEANWLPAPNGTFSLYIRSYWGQKEILDGSWQPPAIVKY